MSWAAYVDVLRKQGAAMAAILTHDGTVCAKSAGCAPLDHFKLKEIRAKKPLTVKNDHPQISHMEADGVEAFIYGKASGSPNAWAVFVTKQLLIAVAAEGTIPDKLGVALSTLCVKLKKGGF